MKIFQIQINELSPGEAALSFERIAKHRQLIDNGEPFELVDVLKVDGWWVVRNGNNRVRAHIEHCQANGKPLDNICCSLSAALDSRGLGELYKFSRYYGQCVDAFTCMPVATGTYADYIDFHGEVSQEIYK